MSIHAVLLQARVQASPLSRDQVSSLLDFTPQLLNDNNYKVCVGMALWSATNGVVCSTTTREITYRGYIW